MVSTVDARFGRTNFGDKFFSKLILVWVLSGTLLDRRYITIVVFCNGVLRNYQRFDTGKQSCRISKTCDNDFIIYLESEY